MSFFDDMKNFGLVVMIVGVLTAILGIVGIVLDLTDGTGIILWTMDMAYISNIIFGLLLLGYAAKVRSGEISEKIDMLGTFTMLLAIVTILGGIFAAIGAAIDGFGIGAVIGAVVVPIILGLILMFVAKKMMDGQATTLDKIIWFLLVIILVVMTIVSLAGITVAFSGTALGIVAGIGSFFEMLMYIFFLLITVSQDVKDKMGI